MRVQGENISVGFEKMKNENEIDLMFLDTLKVKNISFPTHEL